MIIQIKNNSKRFELGETSENFYQKLCKIYKSKSLPKINLESKNNFNKF